MALEIDVVEVYEIVVSVAALPEARPVDAFVTVHRMNIEEQ